MNFSKSKVDILLPGLAIVGALLLNVANAHLLLLIWVLFSLWEGQKNKPNIDVQVQVWTMLLLSVWITLAQFWSGVGSIGWFTTWTFLAIPMAFIGWQFHSRNHPTSWLFIQNFLGLLGSLLAVWGIVQVAAMDYTRAVGPLSDPNAYGCLLNLLWFPLLTRFLSSRGNIEVRLLGFSLLVIQLSLMMSGSRAASLIWLLLFAAIAFIQWNPVSRLRIVFVCIMAVVNYFIYSLHSSHLGVSSYEAALTLTDPDSADAPRMLMWQSTLQMWLDTPWFGGGLGSWNYLYPAYRAAEETGTSGYYAHNDYLQFLQEGGLVLFVLFFGLCGWQYLGSLRKMAAGSGLERMESIGMLAGIAAVILHATVSFSFYLIYIDTLVGIYLGKLFQVQSYSVQQESEKSSESSSKMIIVIVLMVVVVNGFNALLSSGSLSLLRGESTSQEIIHAVVPQFSPVSYATLLTSIRPSDTNAQRYVTASLEYEVLNNPLISPQLRRDISSEIVDGYELMRKQNIYDATIPANEAGFMIELINRYGSDSNRLLRARMLLNESLHKDPSRVDSAILLAETYKMEGKEQAMYNILNGMIPKVWRVRDKMIIEAEILKQKSPQFATQLSGLQEQLRGMKINCGKWECGERYSQIEKSARETLDNIGSAQ